ncbi:hypothetical protein V1277_003234 [Bradyrhizobium sp. AZCC 1588]
MDTIDEILAAEAPAFARAAKAIITGDAAAVRAELAAEPRLIHARSVSNHHATLLHYVSANGIEPELQCAVTNSDEIAAALLAAGAEVDALCDAYKGRCTTMGLLVSSDHPRRVSPADWWKCCVRLARLSTAVMTMTRRSGQRSASARWTACTLCSHEERGRTISRLRLLPEKRIGCSPGLMATRALRLGRSRRFFRCHLIASWRPSKRSYSRACADKLASCDSCSIGAQTLTQTRLAVIGPPRRSTPRPFRDRPSSSSYFCSEARTRH